MGKFIVFIMYVLWVFSLLGIIVVTFRNFQDTDLNVFVGALLFFTVLNTFFIIKKK